MGLAYRNFTGIVMCTDVTDVIFVYFLFVCLFVLIIMAGIAARYNWSLPKLSAR